MAYSALAFDWIDVLRLLQLLLVGGFFSIALVANWFYAWRNTKSERKASCIAPFVAGPVCALSFWLSPFPLLQQFAWIPLVLDLTVLMLPLIVVGVVLHRLGWIDDPFSPSDSKEEGGE